MTVHSAPHAPTLPSPAGRPALGTHLLRLSAAAVATLTLAACGGSESGGEPGSAGDWAGEIRDSAGIEIVTNPAQGMWEDAPGWTLEETFRVGGMDAPTEAMFGQVVGVDVDASGNVYVADQQAAQIQVFTPDGGFVRTLGKPGSGPGEIGQAMAGVFVMGDQVWSPDMANARVNRWSTGGEMVTALRLDLTQGVPVRWDEVGSDMVAQFRDISPMIAAQQGEEASEAGLDVIRTLGEEGGDTLLSLPRGESFSMAGGMPQLRIFEAEPVWDATPAGIIVSGMNDQIRLEIHQEDGTVERILTLPGEAPEVTEGDQTLIKGAMRDLMQQQGAPPQAVEPMLQGMEFADRYPRFAQVIVGPESSLWLQRIKTADGVVEGANFDLQNLGSDDWDVFDAAGRYQGVISMPTRFQPLREVDGVLWGVQRDEFDVPAVVGYRVVKG